MSDNQIVGHFINGHDVADESRLASVINPATGGVIKQVALASQKTTEQAMQLIDDHELGNGTCIFTRDGEAARYFTDNIKLGMVGVNVPLPVPVACQSFGGWKRSLFGDLYAYGSDSIRFYTHRKTITQRWPSGGVREKSQFSFPSNS